MSTGTEGEKLAAGFLIRQGYSILSKNVRVPGGEIDLIVRAPDGTLVFSEVKTLRGEPLGLAPEDNLTFSKLKKMRHAAIYYSSCHPELVVEKRGWRIDVLAVVLGSNGVDIRHYKNAA